MSWIAHWRWWLWGLIPILLLCLLIDPLLTRRHGVQRCRAVIAVIKSAGSLTDISELIALAPPIDDDAEAAWGGWLDHLRAINKSGDDFTKRDWFNDDLQRIVDFKDGNPWWMGSSPRAPEKLHAALNRYRTLVEEARRILRRGTLDLTWFGACISAMPDGRRVKGMRAAYAIWDFRPILLVAQWLSCDALLSPSPGEDLDDLQRIMSALTPAGTATIASWDLTRLTRLRDMLLVQLELAGRLDDAARGRWLAEPNRMFTCAADAVRFQRINYLQRLAEEQIGATPFDVFRIDSPPNMGKFNSWIENPGGFADVIAISAQLEDRFRGAPVPIFATSLLPAAAPSSGSWANSLRGLLRRRVTAALQGDCQCTIARLAMRTLLLARSSGGELPDDNDALMRRLQLSGIGNPVGDHYQVRYRKLAPDRFRFAVDPAAPVPDFDPGNVASQIAAPPSSSACEMDNCTIEIQIPPAAP